MKNAASGAPALRCGRFLLPLTRPLIMGVVNITPDSFSDGGAHLDPAAAIEHARRLAAEGADIIDLGGESTRPGAQPVGAAQELARLDPVLAALPDLGVPISVDTSKPDVMRTLLDRCDMVNDVNAFRAVGALEAVAASAVALCFMHMQGEPRTMQDAPQYDDVVGEVHRFLAERIFVAELAGIAKRNIVIDPGFGFGKTTQHNLQLLAQLRRFTELGVPVLAGLSRKRSIGELTGRDDPPARASGSVAAHLIAAQNGAMLLRVHDVAATVDALKVWHAVAAVPAPRKDAGPPAILWPD